MLEKLDELYKIHNERKAVVNLPVSFESTKPGKKNQPAFDPELVVDALEKMRDFLTAETKKIREEFFKMHLEFESKVREKIDKKELEDIESKIDIFI